MAIVTRNTQPVSRHAATTQGKHTPDPAVVSDSYSFYEGGSFKGSVAVLANDPTNTSLWAVHTSSSVASGSVRHGGTVNAPKATLSIVHDGVAYTGYASVGTNGKVNVDFSSANGKLDSLAAGETLSTTFYYTGKGSGGKYSVAPVTLTFVGENDAATITGQSTGSVVAMTGDSADISFDGTLTVHDVDHGEARFRDPANLVGKYGSWNFDAGSGDWSYVVDNSDPDTVALAPGATVYETLTVTSLDGTASQTITVTVSRAEEERADAAFITGPANPWNSTSYDVSMNTVFGEGGWDKFNDTTNENIFDDGYDFIWIDGGDGQTSWFVNYVNLYRSEIEDYVENGGKLLINAARWDEYSDFDLGFGVTLHNEAGDVDNSNTAVATEFADALVDGPHGNAGTSWTGSWFSHDIVTGEDLTPLLVDNADDDIILGGMEYGDGYVMFGGMTAAPFHSPQPQAAILEANIIDFVANYMSEVLPTFA